MEKNSGILIDGNVKKWTLITKIVFPGTQNRSLHDKQ